MKRVWLGFLVVLGMSPVEPIVADEAQVRKAMQNYVVAFNAKDVATIEQLWAEGAVHTDQTLGERSEGRAEIVSGVRAAFEFDSSIQLSGLVDRVRLIKPDVATVEGQVVLTTKGEPTTSSFFAVLVKQGEQWQIDSMEEVTLGSSKSAASALAELDWLIGSWQDADVESPVRATIRPAVGGAFLVRTFEVPLEDGFFASTQVIGWDPRAQQIRSWSFNADGSFGDGIWTKLDGQWSIKSTQTLANGDAASGTYIMKILDNDSFTVQLIEREIEGVAQPESDVVKVLRSQSSEAAGATPAVAPEQSAAPEPAEAP